MEQVGVDELTPGTRCAKDLVRRDNSGFTVKGLTAAGGLVSMWHGIEAVAAAHLGISGGRWPSLRQLSPNCIVCPTAGTVLTAQRRMCTTAGGALSETVATVSLRTKRMLSMFQLRNKNVPRPDRTDIVPGRNSTRNSSGSISKNKSSQVITKSSQRPPADHVTILLSKHRVLY